MDNWPEPVGIERRQKAGSHTQKSQKGEKLAKETQSCWMSFRDFCATFAAFASGCPVRIQKKSRPKAAFDVERKKAQAVSPYTVTLMSTTTSVCSATDTALSPTILIGPLGMRTWAFWTG